MKLLIKALMNEKYRTYTYTIQTHVTVKTSNTVYVAVSADVLSLAAGGEAVKGIITAAKAGKYTKTLWEAFKILQGPIRKLLGRL